MSHRFVYISKGKLHGGLKIRILSPRVKTIFCSLLSFVKILFFPLENKIHIFAPPCNIPYLFSLWKTSFRKVNQVCTFVISRTLTYRSKCQTQEEKTKNCKISRKILSFLIFVLKDTSNTAELQCWVWVHAMNLMFLCSYSFQYCIHASVSFRYLQ